MKSYINYRSFFIIITVFIFSGLEHGLCQELRHFPVFSPRPSFTISTDTPVINLNGTWQFSENPSERFWRSPKNRNASWKDIQVPGEWLMQGFDVKPNTMAAYSNELEIPSSWKDHLILLKCDGVYSLSKVYVNGKLAGGHEGGFTPYQLDVTDFLRPGKRNTIIIGVQNESLADTLASATQYAAHSLGGITRKLELYALPMTYIKSAHYTTVLNGDNTKATVNLDLVLANNGKKRADKLAVKISMSEKRGPSILFPGNTKAVPAIPAGGEVELKISLPVKDPQLWDPEHPNLYNCQISLSEEKEVIQKVTNKIGVREVEVVGNQVFVNGKPIKMRGVNRHEVHPTKGRSLSMEEWEADARLFKEANVNYIRTSHYPPAEEFVAICDSLGLFVELEAPLCWIGHGANAHWQKADPHSPELYPLIRQLVLETVAQYRNHPSVIIWSMANESAWGPNWEAVLKEVNALEPSRPVSFHDQAYGGFNNFGSTVVQIGNIHYPGPAGPDVAWKFERPLLFGEYAHLNTYNRQEIVTDPGVRDAWGRGLESMWEKMYNSTGCLGGAIWSGIDDVFYLPDGKAVGYGEWGPIDGWRRPKPEYWHLKKIYSPVKVSQNHIPRPVGKDKTIKVAVENRHLFTNMSELDIIWEVGSQSGKSEMDLSPGARGILRIDPDNIPEEAEHMKLSFHSPQGFMIDSYVLSLGDQIKKEKEGIVIEPELLVNDNRVSVSIGEVIWSFSAETGKLQSVREANKIIVEDGPDLMILPLRTGPCNTEHSLEIETLNETCKNWKGEVTGTGKEGDLVYIEVEGSYDEADLRMVYWFGRSENVEIEYELMVKSDIDPRQIGLVFTMPREFENFSWERKGQWTLYPKTHLGRTSGSAVPFPGGKLKAKSNAFGDDPGNIWEADFHPMGVNDFRATRDKLIWAKLSNDDGVGISLVSDGTGAIRPFVNNDKLQFLAAGFSTAGGDLFFSSHLRNERNPLKEGDKFRSKLVLGIY